MVKQAKWNNITWGASSRQVALLKSIKLSRKLKVEEKTSKKGGNKTIVKSLEPETLSLQYTACLSAYLDPRGEFEMLKKAAGMQDYFHLGGTQISKNLYELDEINLENTILDNSGRIVAGDLTLNFNTESAPSTKGGKGKKKKGKKGKKKKGASLSLFPGAAAKIKGVGK